MTLNPSPFGLLVRLRRGLRPFVRAQVRELERDRMGVYAIWEPAEYGDDGATCSYVGMSLTCVRRRLLDHLSDEVNPELRYRLQDFRDHVSFSVVFTEGDAETRALESYAIREWEPAANRR